MVNRTRRTGAPEARPVNRLRPHTDDPWTALKKAWQSVGSRLPELGKDARCYAAVQIDRAKLAATKAGTAVALGIFGLFAGVALFAIAFIVLLQGVVGGLAAALDGNTWLASLITGAAILLLMFGSIAFALRRMAAGRLRRLEERYECHSARHRASVTPPPAPGMKPVGGKP